MHNNLGPFGCCGESCYPEETKGGGVDQHFGCKCCWIPCGWKAVPAAGAKSAAGLTVFLMMAAHHVENNSLYQGLLALAFFMAIIAMVAFAKRRPVNTVVGSVVATMKEPLVEPQTPQQDSMA